MPAWFDRQQRQAETQSKRDRFFLNAHLKFQDPIPTLKAGDRPVNDRPDYCVI
ncbi:hypothetical protein [Chamaesiphon polymorphus]|uniref:hypothetical protein n=1 Tax=Chamaesiphon polymorphus TaxID=2107691 RepID=UPI0015E79561|nr:hypothetical protein [Chamaesiphon polymorphus]